LPFEGDDSTKTAIPSNSFPPQWALRANLTFNGLGEYAFRPDHWGDYAPTVKGRRETATSLLEQVVGALDGYFRDPAHEDITGKTIRLEAFDEAAMVLKDLPLLPKDAVDGWGRTSESAAREAERNPIVRRLKDGIPALQRYSQYLKALHAYLKPLTNFVRQAAIPLAAIPHFARATSANQEQAMRKALAEMGHNDAPARLPLTNLFDAWTELSKFQREFRGLFLPLVDERELEVLEERERAVFSRLFPLWLQFATNPRGILTKGTADAERKFKAASEDVVRRLRGKLKKLERYGVHAKIYSEQVLWEERPALWITVAVSDERMLANVFWLVYEQVARSLPEEWTGSLEDFAVRYRWETIHIVPLVSGRIYDGCDWRLPTIVVLGSLKRPQDDKWHYGMLLPLPVNTIQDLDLAVADFAALAPANKVFAAGIQLQLVLSSISDVARMPEPTGVGAEVKQGYFDSRSSDLSSLLTEALAGTFKLATSLGQAIAEADNDPSRVELLVATAASLKKFREVLMPEGLVDRKGSFGEKAMRQWNEQLATGMAALVEMKLAFVAYQRVNGTLL